MKGKFIIVDLRNMDYMKNEEGEINYYDTEEYACAVCGMYEFEDAWVLELKYNHKEKTLSQKRQDRRELIQKFQKWLDTNPNKRIIASQCATIAEEYHQEQLSKLLNR